MPNWYVPHPTSQFVEDVKAIARERGLKVLDSLLPYPREDECDSPPTLTLKDAPEAEPEVQPEAPPDEPPELPPEALPEAPPEEAPAGAPEEAPKETRRAKR